MDFLPVIICFSLGLGMAQFAIPLIQRHSQKTGHDRSFHHTHRKVISRLGGLTFAVTFVAAALFALKFASQPMRRPHLQLVIALTSLAMFAVGFRDDLKPLGARKKFLLQILISTIAFVGGVQVQSFRIPLVGTDIALGWLSGPVTVFWLVSLTNLINLIDGIDGLAAGVGFMLMSLLVVVGVRSGGLSFTGLCATALAGTLLGFLRFNFPPAKIYMGDGGAYFIGFVIGLFTVVNSQKGTIVAALIAPLFALALPIIDVTTAILRRGLNGLPIFRADRKHLHHRLLAKGLSRRHAVVTLYVVCLTCLTFAFAIFCLNGTWLPFVFGGFAVTLLLAARSIDFGRDYLALGRVLGNSIDLRKDTRYALPLVRWLELEAERAESLDELCDGFGFICRKFRFSRVSCAGPVVKCWSFEEGLDDAEDLSLDYEIPLSEGARVEFHASGARLSRASFELLSELAAEAWFKSLQRWRQLHLTVEPFEQPALKAAG